MRLGPWAPRGTGRAPSPRQRWQPRSSAAHDCRAGVVAVSVPQTWPSLSRADGPSMLNGPRISRRDHAYKHLLCELILCELFQWHRPRVQTLSGTNHATNTERQRSRAYALSGADRAYKHSACQLSQWHKPRIQTLSGTDHAYKHSTTQTKRTNA